MRFYIFIMLGILVFFTLAQILPNACQYKPTIPQLSDAEKRTYVAFVASHQKAPEDFVVQSFDNHDVVFLGEFQSFIVSFKQNVQVVRKLIPLLYKKGVTVIGLECALAEDQKEIDALLRAPEYSEQKVKQILSNRFPLFGYQEYADIFKDVWTVNKSLAPYEKHMRIVGLSSKIHIEFFTKPDDEKNPEIIKKVINNTVQEQFIYEVINREIIERNEKALVYIDLHFCLKDVFLKERKDYYGQMGLVYSGTPAMLVINKIHERAMVIFEHNMWIRNDLGKLSFPMDGIFDAVIRELPVQEAATGFLIAESPFKDIPIKTSFILKDDPPITLKNLCDGYIFNGPLFLYRVPTYMASFITDENIEAARQSLSLSGEKAKTMTVQELNEQINKYIESINGLMGALPH